MMDITQQVQSKLCATVHRCRQHKAPQCVTDCCIRTSDTDCWQQCVGCYQLLNRDTGIQCSVVGPFLPHYLQMIVMEAISREFRVALPWELLFITVVTCYIIHVIVLNCVNYKLTRSARPDRNKWGLVRDIALIGDIVRDLTPLLLII